MVSVLEGSNGYVIVLTGIRCPDDAGGWEATASGLPYDQNTDIQRILHGFRRGVGRQARRPGHCRGRD